MRQSIKDAIGTTVQDMVNSGLKSSFTERELNELGVRIPEVKPLKFTTRNAELHSAPVPGATRRSQTNTPGNETLDHPLQPC